MASYPYGHGRWPPPPPAQQPSGAPMGASFNFGPQNGHIAYTSNSYHNTPTPDYYGTSQNAFDQNAGRYGALGIMAPNTGAPVSSWNSVPPQPYASYPPPPPPHQEAAQAADYEPQYEPELFQAPPSKPATVPFPAQSVSPEPSPPPPAEDSSKALSNSGDVEEGELSDSNSEDLYTPDEAGDPSRSHGAPLHGTHEAGFSQGLLLSAAAGGDMPSRDASVIDLQEDAFYDEDDEEEPGEIVSSGNGVAASSAADADDEDMSYSESERPTIPETQPRAASYSPRLDNEEGEPPEVAAGMARAISAPEPEPVAKVGGPVADAVVGADSKAPAPLASQADQAQPATTEMTLATALGAKSVSFSTMEEAEKEAKKVVLRLISYGVNYQTYIEEGFDKDIVKALFAGLNLDALPAPPTEPELKAKILAAPPAAEVKAKAKPCDGSADEPKPEERKDRIARLLALKKASKPRAPPPAPAPPAASNAAPVAATAAGAPASPARQERPDKSKSEKARLLQQKLEALRRRQQEKLQASASLPHTPVKETVPAPVQPPVATVVLSSSGQTNGTHNNNSTPPLAATLAPLQLEPSSPPPPAEPTAPAAPDMAQPLSMPAQRKRPVAADFGDFSAGPSNPLKRPFGQMRHESSLVIDVSDDSDEDVEMEVDSPVDEAPGRALRNGSGLPRTTSWFGDSPLLPDSPTQPRSFDRGNASSGASSGSLNGAGSGRGKAKSDEYSRKMRQIEEMKRKIAEAEAKKSKGTIASTPTTPNTGNSTPSAEVARTSDTAVAGARQFAEAVSARLPKRSDAASASSHESHHERRTRIASHQLPRVEASLQEKMFKLKLLQEKMSALQADISAGMAEKQRLTEEMDRLSPDSPEGTPQTSAEAGEAVEETTARETAATETAATETAATETAARETAATETAATATAATTTAKEFVVTPDLDDISMLIESALGEQPLCSTSKSVPESVSASVELVSKAAAAPAQVVASPPVVAEPTETAEVEADGGKANGLTLRSDAPQADFASSAEESSRSPSAEAVAAAVETAPEALREEGERGPAAKVTGTVEGPMEVEDGSLSSGSDDDNADVGMDEDATTSDEDDEDEDNAESEAEMELDEPEEPEKPEKPVQSELLKQPEQPPVERAPAVDARLQETTEAPATSLAMAQPTSLPPYESPLKIFRSYRFHPQYRKTVKGGLKSLTYSSKIQPDKELCPRELEGGECTDPSCKYQHIATVLPPEDHILVDLGRSDEFKGERKSQFVSGLRDVLKRFREAKVRDFETIAYEIVNFRRQFLGDESRVLCHLEDVTI